MSDFKQRVLRKLAGDVSEGTDWVLDKLDRPGRATRAGIGAYQNDEDVLEAIKAQLGENPPEAPSGTDIADKFSEDHGVTNPYALTALATAAEVVDPTMFIPGGQISKVGKVGRMAKMAEKGETAADILRNAKKSQYGKVAVVKTAEEKALEKLAGKTPSNISSLPEQKVQTNLPEIFGKQQTDELYDQFPGIAEKYRGKNIVAPKKFTESE